MTPGSAKPLRLSCAKRRPPAMAARSHVSLPLDVLSIGGPSSARLPSSFLALCVAWRHLALRPTYNATQFCCQALGVGHE